MLISMKIGILMYFQDNFIISFLHAVHIVWWARKGYRSTTYMRNSIWTSWRDWFTLSSIIMQIIPLCICNHWTKASFAAILMISGPVKAGIILSKNSTMIHVFARHERAHIFHLRLLHFPSSHLYKLLLLLCSILLSFSTYSHISW